MVGDEKGRVERVDGETIPYKELPDELKGVKLEKCYMTTSEIRNYSLPPTDAQIALVNEWVDLVCPRVIQIFGFFDGGVNHSFARSADETDDEYDSP